jgi:hypothetical protein
LYEGEGRREKREGTILQRKCRGVALVTFFNIFRNLSFNYLTGTLPNFVVNFRTM